MSGGLVELPRGLIPNVVVTVNVINNVMMSLWVLLMSDPFFFKLLLSDENFVMYSL